MPTDFTSGAVVAEVRKLAAERPAFTYRAQPELEGNEGGRCSYLGAYQPGYDPEVIAPLDAYRGEGCMMGQALERLGVKREALLEVEGDPVHNILAPLGCTVESLRDTMWLRLVQSRQDTGSSWGLAVEAADLEVSIRGY